MARHTLVAIVIALGLSASAFRQPSTQVYRVGWLGCTGYDTPDCGVLAPAGKQVVG